MHDFVLDVEVQLAPEETTQILVDEVVRRVLGGVVAQVLFQQGALRALLRRRAVAQGQPAGLDGCVRQHCLYGLGDQRLLLGTFGLGGVLEADDQLLVAVTARCLLYGHLFLFVFVAVFIQSGDGFRRHQGKATLLVVVLPVVLGGVGGGEAEMHRAAVFQLEAVVAEVLAALGVVLILIGPVQHHLFARVGDGVGVALVTALADEVALLVVAGEKGQQVGEHGVVVFAAACGGILQLRAQFLHLGHGVGADAQGLGVLLGLLQFSLQLLRAGGAACGEGCLHLLGQPVLQVVVDLARAGVEDAVDTEVQFRAVDLEDLAQLGDELLEFGILFVGHGLP